MAKIGPSKGVIYLCEIVCVCVCVSWGGTDMQQRAIGWNQTHGGCKETQPLFMRCLVYQLSHCSTLALCFLVFYNKIPEGRSYIWALLLQI